MLQQMATRGEEKKRQKEKEDEVKCRNIGKEIKTERWKTESGTEREAGREG